MKCIGIICHEFTFLTLILYRDAKCWLQAFLVKCGLLAVLGNVKSGRLADLLNSRCGPKWKNVREHWLIGLRYDVSWQVPGSLRARHVSFKRFNFYWKIKSSAWAMTFHNISTNQWEMWTFALLCRPFVDPSDQKGPHADLCREKRT